MLLVVMFDSVKPKQKFLTLGATKIQSKTRLAPHFGKQQTFGWGGGRLNAMKYKTKIGDPKKSKKICWRAIPAEKRPSGEIRGILGDHCDRPRAVGCAHPLVSPTSTSLSVESPQAALWVAGESPRQKIRWSIYFFNPFFVSIFAVDFLIDLFFLSSLHFCFGWIGQIASPADSHKEAWPSPRGTWSRTRYQGPSCSTVAAGDPYAMRPGNRINEQL